MIQHDAALDYGQILIPDPDTPTNSPSTVLLGSSDASLRGSTDVGPGNPIHLNMSLDAAATDGVTAGDFVVRLQSEIDDGAGAPDGGSWRTETEWHLQSVTTLAAQKVVGVVPANLSGRPHTRIQVEAVGSAGATSTTNARFWLGSRTATDRRLPA